jgi:hypothetical protein
MSEKFTAVDQTIEGFQLEITNMQTFQESEGTRQKTMWDANGKFSNKYL